MRATYRDDASALRAHRDALARELAEVEKGLEERDGLEARARELRQALADAADLVRQARVRSKLPLLDVLTIATPCQQSWNEMVGDDRKRFCGKCEKHVYDLSQMTAPEAEALLAAEGKPCLRIHRRPDGTVMTSDCPEGAKRRKRRRRIVIAAGTLIAASLTATVSAPMMVMGKAECPTAPPEPPVQVTQPAPERPLPPPDPTIGEPPSIEELQSRAEQRARMPAPSGRPGR